MSSLQERLKAQQGQRKPSAGLIVLGERFQSKKKTNQLIESDLAAYSHYKASRRREAAGADPDEGNLVIGESHVTWLGADDATVLASHPIVFIESYGVDLHDPSVFYFTVKPKTLKSLLIKDDLFSFAFILASAEVVRTVVSRLDSLVLATHRDMVAEAFGERCFYDTARIIEAHKGDPVTWIDGERFSVELTGAGVPESREAVAVFHDRGIVLLEFPHEMRQFAFANIESFGASSEQQFGFKVKAGGDGDDLAILRTDEAGHLMNALMQRNLTTFFESEGAKAQKFPLAYRPSFEKKKGMK